MNVKTAIRRGRRGLSLVEVAICSLLVGILLVGAMRCLGAVVSGRSGNGDSARAGQLARELMTEILNTSYIDDTSPVFGVETDETVGNRTTYDDADDFSDWSASPPQDRSGSPLPNVTGWQREVTVTWVDPADPATISGSDLGAKRITVTIRRDGRVLAELVALRSDSY